MKKSFQYAFSGVLSCINTERNMRFHLAVTFYVILAGLVTGLDSGEWAEVLICAALVLGSELINTGIEYLCDAVHPDYSKGVGMAKDAAAGAVLVFATGSVVIGSIVFFNAEKISAARGFTTGHPVLAALIILTVPLMAYFVFRRRKNDK